ncbi:MAG: DUF1841 family protein [Woeseiaceae bacterium]|nr:DUF1841 family protein [Woeseiaceae bacterium]
MLFGQNRAELRQIYVDAWRKLSMGAAMTPLEVQITDVIRDHPEYQAMMTSDKIVEDYSPDGGQTNPFLHMGLHLAIREQLATDRPPGIASLFNTLLVRTGDAHEAEHQALECLAETLWEAQRNNALPDEQAYLERLRHL